MEDKKILFDINGLVAYATREDSIPAEFGMGREEFVSLSQSMFKYCAYDMLVQDENSIVAALDKYLKSEEFAKTGFKIEKPNDFFLLGFAFSITSKRLNSLEGRFKSGRSESDPLSMLMDLIKSADKVEVVKHEVRSDKKPAES